MAVTMKDREILRGLAGSVGRIAALPEMETRRQNWIAFNSLRPRGPMVLCFPEAAWKELVPEGALGCEDPLLRAWERRLESQIYWWEHLRDDNVLDPWFDIPWDIKCGDDPAPLKDLEAGLKNLKPREFSVDREATGRSLALAGQIFGDLLPARARGQWWWLPVMAVTQTAVKLMGMERFMASCAEEPDIIRQLLAFLGADAARFVEWMEAEGVLSPNHRADYIGSGGVGYTGELPASDFKEGGPWRARDSWGFFESQETQGVSPAMFEKHIFPHLLPLAAKFGLNAYGCCEPLEDRLDTVLRIPGLRRVSVSPWCRQEAMAARLGKRFIFSRKPNPALVCAGFDEAEIRKDLRRTLEIAGQGVLEIIMKDITSVRNEPWRLERWLAIAYEETARFCAS